MLGWCLVLDECNLRSGRSSPGRTRTGTGSCPRRSGSECSTPRAARRQCELSWVVPPRRNTRMIHQQTLGYNTTHTQYYSYNYQPFMHWRCKERVKVQATLLLITDSTDDWVIFHSNEMHNCQPSNEIFSLLLSHLLIDGQKSLLGFCSLRF